MKMYYAIVSCSYNCMFGTTIEVIKWKGAWPEKAIHVKILRAGCGQEEPGSIMQVKLAGSYHVQKFSNYPHQSKITI